MKLHQPIRHLPLKLALFFGLCALPFFGAVDMWLTMNFIWPACIYILVSLVTFGFYWSDKRRAQTQQRRISENSLHLLELLGGWPGALLAQQLFRHKTRKVSFQLVFWLITLIHLAFWSDWFLTGGHYSSLLLKFLMGR